MFPIGDAIDYYSNGVIWLDNTDGAANKKLEVYQGVSSGNSANFSKGTGVGDIEFMCAVTPAIEIGNIVWWDEDLDGLQDPSEPGIANVTLELWVDPNGNTQGNNPVDGDEIKVAQTTTDAYGRYIFSYNGNSNGLNTEDWYFTGNDRVLTDTFYQIRIPNWATDAGVVAHRDGLGYISHIMSPTQNQIGSTAALGIGRDNNGYDNPGNAAGTVETGTTGENDHTFDFAFGGVGGCEAPEAIPTANTPCKGETLNFIATVTGGTSPYTYNWSGPNGFTATTQNPSITGADSTLHAGIYYLTVTDNGACTDTVHVHVSVNNVEITVASTDATCGNSDGTVDLTVTKGFAPFTYAWSNSETTEDLTGLSSGSYLVTVTDADGCTITETAGINSVSSPTLSETHIDASCGSSNGSINLTITGSHTTINWSNGATTEDISGLAAGTYTVTVNNASNCPATFSILLMDSPVPTVSITQINTTCGNNNGSVDLTVSGGTAPYTFQWDNDGTADGDDVEDVSSLAAGTYNVTVTDANSCTAITPVTLTDTPGPTLTTVPSNESCGQSNGSINLTVTGGTAPFTYTWNNGLTTEDITGLGTGTFEVTVTDANGCIATTTESITNTSGPTLSTVPSDATDCNTSDGAIDLTITGGVGPYTYAWDNGASTEDISSLAAGAYQVTVTDANGCIEYISAGVANAADPVLAIAVTDPVNCGDTGEVDLTISAGTAPYTIDWSMDGLGDNDDVEDVAGLEGGIYDLVVTDAIGCTSTAKVSIKVVRPAALAGTITPSSCGNSDGAIDLVINDPDAGGSPVYTFNWSNGATTEDISGLAAGNYSVTVSNNINCTSEATFSLSDVGGPALSLNQTNPTCNGNNGAIDLTVTGGTPSYTFNWSNGITTEDVTAIANGVYSVTVTDNSGCIAVTNTTLVSSEPPVINALLTPENCMDGQGGSNLTVSGIEPFTYDWSDNTLDGTEAPTGLSAGAYSITVSDGNGCTTNTTLNVLNDCAADSSDYADACVIDPCHNVSSNIYLGTTVTADDGIIANETATGDTDEGVYIAASLDVVVGGSFNVPVTMYNNTGNTAYLYIWIDWNGDGDFVDIDEVITSNTYPTGTHSGTYQEVINFSVPSNLNTTQIGLRFRYSTDNSTANNACGIANCATDGEVEDYMILVNCKPEICLPSSFLIRRGSGN